MKRMMGMAALLLAVGLPVSAQTPAQDDAALAALRASMSASAHAQLSATVQAARERGLPAQPLIAKAQEGAAKKVTEARVVAAVRTHFDRLGRAQTLLAAGAAPATAVEISGVADALQRGVPEEAITKLIVDARGGGHVALSAHALADMMRHGVPLAVGVEVLGAWRGRGADPTRLSEIPAAVDRLVRQGVVPARAGAAVAAGLRLGRAPGSITPGEIPGILRRRGGGDN